MACFPFIPALDGCQACQYEFSGVSRAEHFEIALRQTHQKQRILRSQSNGLSDHRPVIRFRILVQSGLQASEARAWKLLHDIESKRPD